jgi:hypothetical protein
VGSRREGEGEVGMGGVQHGAELWEWGNIYGVMDSDMSSVTEQPCT